MGGEPKAALLELGGRRIIERVLDVLRAVADLVLLLVTNTPGALSLPGAGDDAPTPFPTAARWAASTRAFARAPGEIAFTVACDMPFVSPAVARLVTSRAPEADVVAPRVGEQWETLHACYGKACLGPMERRLRAGRLKITRLLRRGARAGDPGGGDRAARRSRPRLR